MLLLQDREKLFQGCSQSSEFGSDLFPFLLLRLNSELLGFVPLQNKLLSVKRIDLFVDIQEGRKKCLENAFICLDKTFLFTIWRAHEFLTFFIHFNARVDPHAQASK